MNYSKIYNDLIDRARNRELLEYTEKHRIIPGCMGGEYTEENVVHLTPEEHYVAHQLLVKIYPDNHRLAKAAMMMTAQRPTNKIYGWLRRRHAEAQSACQTGEGNSQYGTMWVYNTELRQSKKVPSGKIPEGWKKGRIIDFDKKAKLEEKKKAKLEEKKKAKLEEKHRKRQKEVDKYREYYKLYASVGWDEFVKQTGYSKSKPNLVTRFKVLLPEFVPQNGKRRGFIPV